MPIISLTFTPEMEDAILSGKKCCTTRIEQKGEPGDLFIVKDRIYRILQVNKRNHPMECFDFGVEGFASYDECKKVIESIYPHLKEICEFRSVYIYYFTYVTTISGDTECYNCPCIEYLNDGHTKYRCQVPGVRFTEEDIVGCPGGW